MESLKIAVAGFGTVGKGLAELLSTTKEHILERTGRNIVLYKVAVRREEQRAEITAYGAVMTTNWQDLTDDPQVDVVVELIGGTTVAKELITKALQKGKHVVTANKALLAEHGKELFTLADEKGVHLCFEASVAGGIPVVETLKGGLAGNPLKRVMGILNGTANFILTQMSAKGLGFDTALKMAQEKGFAEADPTLDIEGFDAAHKLILLIQLAFGRYYPLSHLPVTGITVVEAMDIAFAKELGYVVKLIAQARQVDGFIEAGVYPALVPQSYLLASVNGSFNAIRFDGEGGPVVLHGHGAGGLPTGSAVLADIMAVAGEKRPDGLGFIEMPLPHARILDLDEAVSHHYVRFIVPDAPGVLRDIAGVMSANDISLSQIIQKDSLDDEGHVPLVFLTHKTSAQNIHTAMQQVKDKGLSHGKTMHFRIL